MNAYKIDLSGFTGKVREVVSEAVQKKAFALGCKWPDGGKDARYVYDPYLYLEQSGKLLGGTLEKFFEDDDNTAITAADFLALETAKEPEFKPEQLVLVRDKTEGYWSLAQFSHRRGHSGQFVVMGGIGWDQCIPYEGNEHLVGTIDSLE